MTKPHLDAAEAIRARLDGRQPRLAVILGSGLGDLADRVEDAAVIPYGDIPGYPAPKVAGHSGRLVAGRLGGRDVLVAQGRAHYYEGHPADRLALPVRSFKALGVTAVLITNAAGSLVPQMPPGSLMAIADHINWSGANPLIGDNDPDIGERFVPMNDAWDPDLRARLIAALRAEGQPGHTGVYIWWPGPTFETPAEIRAMKVLGADAVGMSTVPECIAARHCGLKVAGLSVITNLAAGMADHAPSHAETVAETAKAAARFIAVVTRFAREAPV